MICFLCFQFKKKKKKKEDERALEVSRKLLTFIGSQLLFSQIVEYSKIFASVASAVVVANIPILVLQGGKMAQDPIVKRSIKESRSLKLAFLTQCTS